MWKNNKIFYNKIVKSIIPAGEGNKLYKNRDWKDTHLVLTKDRIVYKSNGEQGYIPLGSIYYIDRDMNFSKGDSPQVITIDYSTDNDSYIGLIKPPNKSSLKEKIFRNMISGVNIYFISPYKVGYHINPQGDWKEGFFGLDGYTIRITDRKNHIINQIPRRSIFLISNSIVKGYDCLKISYEKEGQCRTDLLYSPNLTVHILQEFFDECFLKESEKIPILEGRERELVGMMKGGGEEDEEEKVQYSTKELADELGLDIKPEGLLDLLDEMIEKDIVKVIDQNPIVSLTSTGKVAYDKSTGEEKKDIEEKISQLKKKSTEKENCATEDE